MLRQGLLAGIARYLVALPSGKLLNKSVLMLCCRFASPCSCASATRVLPGKMKSTGKKPKRSFEGAGRNCKQQSLHKRDHNAARNQLETAAARLAASAGSQRMKPDDACNKQGLHLPHPAKLPHMTPEDRLGPGICNAMPKMFVASSKDAMSSTTSAGETSASATQKGNTWTVPWACNACAACASSRDSKLRSRRSSKWHVLSASRASASALSVLGM